MPDNEVVKCMCKEHNGKEMLNKIYQMSVNHAFDCIFTDSDFNLKYWKAVKFENIKTRKLKVILLNMQYQSKKTSSEIVSPNIFLKALTNRLFFQGRSVASEICRVGLF